MVPIRKFYEEWKKGFFPGHLLYGLTHLEKYGLIPVYHSIPFNPYKGRFRLMCYNLMSILFSKESFEAIYAVTHVGLELIILLRALGLYKKPIFVWHHTAVSIPENVFIKALSGLFYKGIDKLFFFSKPLLEQSLKTGKVRKEDAFVIHWGPDLDFYDKLIKERIPEGKLISTGREKRDFITLIHALNKTGMPGDIYTTVHGVHIDYGEVLKEELKTMKPNVHLSFVDASHYDMARIANNAYVIAISCLDFPYTVGLTSLVEAMGLGLPVITTDNPAFPIDAEREETGIKVSYGNEEAWIKAIDYLQSHPERGAEMGKNARKLAEKEYNLDICTEEIATVLKSAFHRRSK
jgi:glycosyltransferase involved in cell wall biosynthesis